MIAVVTEESTVVVKDKQTSTVVVGDKQSSTVVVGTGAASIPQKLVNNQDVDTTYLENGSILVYNAGTLKWTAGNILANQIIDSGQF